ncbi:site-specific integrase [Parashewanella spongiae]|uniref:site-specific integrase n=1 Tax=Parashewanella spongiae TaxID=342950 RepID=UPI0014052CAC|nr:site-specific integrase [Parashewanella spongiae]MCL1077211.1 site-specific integrase [Parashewanella spongiae]
MHKRSINSLIQKSDTDWHEESYFPQSVTDDLNSAVQETKHQISINTQRSYKSSFNIFHEYCEQHGLSVIPADPRSIMAFIGFQKSQINMTGHHFSLPTINSRLAAIRFYHQQAGFVSPTEHPDVLKILRGLSRNQYRNTVQYHQQPIMYDELELLINMIEQNENELIRLRDKALILLGFQGGFRRSELSKIQVEHISFLPKKMKVRLPYSKANQQGKNEWKLLPTSENFSAYTSIKNWLTVAGITSGHVFRSISRDGKSIRPYFVASDHSNTSNLKDQTNSGFINGDDIYRIIKKYCNKAGLDPEFYGAHSLRSGCVTQLHENDKDYLYIMSRTGHADPRSLKNYLKPKD